MYGLFENFFRMAAWPMTPPAPYSWFHLLLTASGCFTAWQASKKAAGYRALFSCGLLLAFLELFKQGFLFFVVNNGFYDWWYFPFQLCSIPMYLGLALPLVRSAHARSIMAAFIQDFGLLGGILALLVPPGLMHPYWVLTLHGFLWHFILIFMGLGCARNRIAGHTGRDFLEILPLFFICCLTALFINLAAGPESGADMFYISPYSPSSQPLFHRLSLLLGTLPEILLYIAAMILGGWAVHLSVNRFFPPKSGDVR